MRIDGSVPRTIFLLLALFVGSTSPAAIAAEPAGAGRAFALIGTQPIVVYTYRPAPCPEPKLLIVFAGYNRDADRYRDRARGIADRACLWVVAPLLERDRFPAWRYQLAGVAKGERIQPKTEWSSGILPGLVAWARTWAERPQMPYLLFGHSAGAQFLSRIAAYMPPDGVERIVIANPSAHVWPSLQERAPYGFAGVFDEQSREVQLRKYLAQPVTIYLGQDDTGEKLLVTDEPAMRQGANRLERGRNVYLEAKRIANERSWQFGWRLIEVANSGHSASAMLSTRRADEALGLRTLEPVR